MKPKFRKGQDIVIVMSELPEVISSVELVRDHHYNTMYHYTLEGRDSSLKYVEAELMTVEEASKAGVRHKTLHKSERNSNYVAPPPNVTVQVAVGGVFHNYILEESDNYSRSSSSSSSSSSSPASDYTPSYSYDSGYSSSSYDGGSCSSSSSCD